MSSSEACDAVRRAPSKISLLCFSHLRWHFVTQRPQHLLTRAAASFEVMFLEEPVFGDWGAELRVDVVDGVRLAVPHLPHGLSDEARDATLATMVATLLEDRAPAIFWYYTPAAVAFSRHLPRALTIYDNMDELSAFRGASPDLLRLEQELIDTADLVFTGGWSLYEAKRSRHRSVHCLPSSVDVAHFSRARGGDLPDPADQAGLTHPRLGFFGVVDERMDLDFLAALAALRPHWQFVMLGPVVKIDPSDLPRPGNVHWLGMKRYDELPAYLAHWDLALMPFALNESTRFISPTKTPEFLAGGLPVVSTPVADVVRAYGGADALVAIAATPAEAATLADTLLGAPRDTWLVRVDKRLAEGSWDRTWRTMRDLIDEALPEHGQLSPAAATRRSGALTQA